MYYHNFFFIVDAKGGGSGHKGGKGVGNGSLVQNTNLIISLLY